MMACQLSAAHIGRRYTIRFRGAKPVEGGLSDYQHHKQDGDVMQTTVFIGGTSRRLSRHVTLTPVEEGDGS